MAGIRKLGIWYIKADINEHRFDHGDIQRGADHQNNEIIAAMPLPVVISNTRDTTQRSQRDAWFIIKNVVAGSWGEGYSALSEHALGAENYAMIQIQCDDGRTMRQWVKDGEVACQAVLDEPGHEELLKLRWGVMESGGGPIDEDMLMVDSSDSDNHAMQLVVD
ncbi:hypothetical protein H2200_001204 [Cladophialophora chaetospira]|uniref:Uncharacterized protein n=1 Tax=Cladophialophora chaetospira TaxID=386627 RepID=A0AA39CPD4_9EURO|nr:hypothetical protein H2200_001204 [Cladophialophora chaetospira]